MSEDFTLSARFVLTEEEQDFCLKFKGGLTQTEAYRRAYYPASKGWIAHNDRSIDEDPKAGIRRMPQPKEISRRAGDLLKEQHIQRFLVELETKPLDRANEILRDAALTAEGAEARQIAKLILEQKNQLGVVSATERFTEIMCAIGAKVKIPIPGVDPVDHPSIEFKEMFPRYREALPPVDVIEKTIRSLEEYKEKVEERESADV